MTARPCGPTVARPLVAALPLAALPLGALPLATLFVATVSAAPVAAQTRSVQRIFDASYFDGLGGTLIDFETDGSGTPIDIVEGSLPVEVLEFKTL